MSSKVFIIILQYNNSYDTLECLKTVQKLNYSNFKAIIIDNNSGAFHQKNIEEYVSSHNSLFSILYSNENLGYAGGNNIGIKYALEHGAEYVLVLNNDTTVPNDLLDKMLNAFESDEEIGIAGSAINEDDRIICGGKIKWLKPELQHSSPSTINYKLKTVNFYLPGACLLIKSDVFRKVGFLDERYFLYFEDADFCLRAQKAGFKLAKVLDAVIQHHASSSTSKLGSPLLFRYHYRNAHLFNWKNGPFWVKILLPFWSISIIIKQIIKMVFVPEKRESSRRILLGVIDFYRGKFGIYAQNRN